MTTTRLRITSLFSFLLVFLFSESITFVFWNSDGMVTENKAYLRLTLMTWKQVTWNRIEKLYQLERKKNPQNSTNFLEDAQHTQYLIYTC